MKAKPMSLAHHFCHHLRIGALMIFAGLVAACGSKPVTVNAPPPACEGLHADRPENTLDWVGHYKTVMPCLDCKGVVLSVSLRADKTAVVSESRIEETSTTAAQTTYSGPFFFGSLNPHLILLSSASNSAPRYQFFIGENWIELRNRATGRPLSHDNSSRLPKINSKP